MMKFTATLFNRIEVDVEVDHFYYDPGRYDGAPENCYPVEQEVEFGRVYNGYGRESPVLYALLDNNPQLMRQIEDTFWEAFHDGEFAEEDCYEC